MCHRTFTNHLQIKLNFPSGSPYLRTIHLNSQRWVTPCQSRWLVQESRTSWTMGFLLMSSPLPQTKGRKRDDIIVHWWWHQSLTHPGSGGQADHAAVLRGEEGSAANNNHTQSFEHLFWMCMLPDLSVGRGGVPPMRSSSSSSESEMEEAKVTADSRSSPLRPSSLINSARPFAGRPLSPSRRSNCMRGEGG